MNSPSATPRSGIRAVVRTRAPRGAPADEWPEDDLGYVKTRPVGAPWATRGRCWRRGWRPSRASATGARSPDAFLGIGGGPAARTGPGRCRARQIGSNDVGEIS